MPVEIETAYKYASIIENGPRTVVRELKILSDVTSEQISTQGQSETVRLFHSRGWKIRRVLLPTLAIFTVLATAVPTLLATQKAFSHKAPYGCTPKGETWVSGKTSLWELCIWNIHYALAITIPFGPLPYLGARVIDISWDLVIARGFQVVAGFFVYNVFRTAMVDTMRSQSLPQEELMAIEYSTTSTSALWTYIKCYNRWNRSKSHRFNMLVLIASTAYVLAVPTLLSAMTGYQSKMEPMFLWNDSYVEFSRLQPCRFAIVDGSRVGLGNDACIPFHGNVSDAISNYANSTSGLDCYPRKTTITLRDDTSESIRKTTWTQFNEAEVLRHDCKIVSTVVWANGTRTHLPSPVLRIEGGAFWYQNTTIYGAYLTNQNTTMCRTLKSYEWGFSFLLLFSFMVTTVPLTLLLLAIWWRHHDKLWSQQVDMLFGSLKTALAVTASIRARIGDRVDDMTNSELRRVLEEGRYGVKHEHAGSDIMSRPGPGRRREEQMGKGDGRFEVGSDSYNAYLQDGLASLGGEPRRPGVNQTRAGSKHMTSSNPSLTRNRQVDRVHRTS